MVSTRYYRPFHYEFLQFLINIFSTPGCKDNQGWWRTKERLRNNMCIDGWGIGPSIYYCQVQRHQFNVKNPSNEEVKKSREKSTNQDRVYRVHEGYLYCTQSITDTVRTLTFKLSHNISLTNLFLMKNPLQKISQNPKG